MNLKTRLSHIRASGHTRQPGETGRANSAGHQPNGHQPAVAWSGWTEAGYKTLKRKVSRQLAFAVPKAFPPALAAVVPDIARAGRIPSAGDLLFFDLETTGLSGGAGTVAFLAAFGRFADSGGIEITQYLLLDYPGEADFIGNVLGEFGSPDESPPNSATPLVVSYNGKSFDSQILRTRCLMNGLAPPEYLHADLLHPARRLWKGELASCSQSVIEVSVLGLDRGGDVSGAMAPDIWFSFLRGDNASGDNAALLAVCDHNVRDISGLACLFLALGEIAAAPIVSRKRFRFNEEALALSWRRALKNYPLAFSGDAYRRCAETGDMLLKNAAENGKPRAAIMMAKIAEWRCGDPAGALAYTNAALAAADALPENLRHELEKRRTRLQSKLSIT